jgi:uncharacterized membrane protein YphA (DoxX/SURF4 family)
MKSYWPILLLRVSLAGVFLYFGQQAILHPEIDLTYVSPAFLALSPVPGNILMMIVGILHLAMAGAFLFGVWIDLAGVGAALLVLFVIVSLLDISGPNEIVIRDQAIMFGCLVLAFANHKLALQPSLFSSFRN